MNMAKALQTFKTDAARAAFLNGPRLMFAQD